MFTLKKIISNYVISNKNNCCTVIGSIKFENCCNKLRQGLRCLYSLITNQYLKYKNEKSFTDFKWHILFLSEENWISLDIT